MAHTLKWTAEIAADRRLMIDLPKDIPIGSARILVEVTPEAESLMNERDIKDARLALEEAEREGTVSLAQLKAEIGL